MKDKLTSDSELLEIALPVVAPYLLGGVLFGITTIAPYCIVPTLGALSGNGLFPWLANMSRRLDYQEYKQTHEKQADEK